ncbi:MAG: M28 family peptidase, partial [Candidatus Bathyarchaeia archaeon]
PALGQGASISASAFLNPEKPLGSVREMRDLIPDIVGFLDLGRIEAHLRRLAPFSRFTGHGGCLEAAEYIRSELESYGLEPFLDYYNLTVPVDRGANLTVLGMAVETGAGVETRTKSSFPTFRIYPLLPNLVCPPTTPGLEGPLLYGGRGTLPELEGKILNGSIVLLDFNCEYEWLNAVNFGAKAILFIEPEETTSYECESKRIYAPVNIPRFLILREDALRLMEALKDLPIFVRIEARMNWEQRLAANVIALIPGEINETIALFSFFDAWSIAPSIAYDADSACGVAFWLEAARFFSLHRPYRNILLVSFSGHWQTLAGARAFVDKYFFGGETPLGFQYGRQIRFALGFDFSTDSSSACVAWGTMGGNSLIQIARVGMAYMVKCVDPLFYWGKPNAELTKELQEPINDESLVYYMNEVMKNRVGYSYMIGDRASFTYPLSYTGSVMRLESQLIFQIGGLGQTIITSLAYRLHWGLPLRSEKGMGLVNLSNLKPQAEFALCAAYLYTWLAPDVLNSFMNKPEWTKWDGTGFGWPRFEGKVLRFDVGLGKYVEVPNALILFTPPSSFYYEIVVKSAEDGSFSSTGFYMGNFNAYGFVINETTGNVEYAPDSGIYGARYSQSFQFWLRTMWHEVEPLNIPVFRCGSIVFHGLIDPKTMDVRTSFTARVNDASSHAELMTFSDPTIITTGYFNPNAQSASIPPSVSMVLFIPPNTDAELTLYVGQTLIGILNNKGKGYRVEGGEVVHKLGPMEVTSDILFLNEERLRILHEHSVYGGMGVPEATQAKALNYFEEAQKALEEKDYARSFYYVYKSWGYALESYLMVKDTFIDTINSVAFISILSIAFAILLERLLFTTTGFHRAFTVILTFSIITALGFYLHPGYTMASNIGLEILSLSVIFLLIPTIALLYSMASHQLT